jgi:UDP-3-O-[3-hydroxymyristoyl] N-acetylglucosamine deacetylase/3-hydroxyacyl-[acyl-carrier-protein] dehydratase
LRNKQKTLSKPIEIIGKSLHLGQDVKMRLVPAEPDTGIVFIRIGVDGEAKVKATYEQLSDKPLRTAINKGGVGIETVEHFLAAAHGIGLHNCLVEIDGPEPPATDGSALQFSQKILDAGLVEQEAERPVFKVSKPISIGSPAGGNITVYPYKGLKITYILSGPGLPNQCVEYEHSTEAFLEKIAPARTFCRESDVEELQSIKGIGDGASEENTILVRLEDLDEKQRIENELASHKILDLLGDLYLFGMDIEGHFICHHSGHSCNHLLLKELRKSCEEFNLNINSIKEILPHAYPFLLVDRILDYKENERVVGLKNVTVNEPFFIGHFPDEPIMPGVLLIEALAQTGAVFIYRNQGAKTKRLVLFTGVDKVKFRHRVIPGDQLILEVEAKTMKSNMGLVKAKATVEGALACEAELKFMIVEKS